MRAEQKQSTAGQDGKVITFPADGKFAGNYHEKIKGKRRTMITSFSNKSVREIVQLNQKARARNKAGLFVVEGVKMFQEAPEERIVRVYIAQRAERGLREAYEKKLDKVHWEVVADEVFDRMSDTKTPQGVLTLVKQYRYRLEELLLGKQAGQCIDRSTGKRVSIIGGVHRKNLLYMLLEDIQDPGNLGTIFRTGEAVGVDGIIMSSHTVDLYNPKTIRSTMGSIYRVPFFYTEDLGDTIRVLQRNEIHVYAADLNGEKFYDEYDYHGGTAFLIGNEGNGLREETVSCADACISIPMEGNVESLNAATASTVLFYEAYRQRRRS